MIERMYPQLKQQASSTRMRQLLHCEAATREQLRRLEALPSHQLQGYRAVHDRYTSLLSDISRRLLEQHNRKNKTNYDFDRIVAEDYAGYLRSGILSVLVTEHIPKLISAEFRRLLPAQPQDEYPAARRRTRKFYLHLGDTNTGKTYHAIERLKQSGSGLYLAPLRILALENYERLNREGVPCSLLTGEEEIRVEGAVHMCCTVEKANLEQRYDVAVIDEAQLVGDSQRGDAWTRAILGLNCPEIHLCGACTAHNLLIQMIRDCGDEYEYKEYHRLVPLQMEFTPAKVASAGRGDAFVAFSKRGVLALSNALTQRGVANSVIYGDLPPEVRKLQYEAFTSGEHPVLVATDAIGMGVNLPIRRMIFTETEKFDGESYRFLTTQEVKQIAGRAGRIGIYETGYITALDERSIFLIDERLRSEDEPVEQAVVGPSETILQIGLLPLQEKLALWSTEPETLPYYRKRDVRDSILVLDLLKQYRLPEAVQWRLMRVPFDITSDTLLSQFSEYAHQCFAARADTLAKPECLCSTCSEYETYYQQINLYYSFSKAMALPLDEAWVTQARAQTAQTIQSFLTVYETKKTPRRRNENKKSAFGS